MPSANDKKPGQALNEENIELDEDKDLGGPPVAGYVKMPLIGARSFN
jgi:hypothetical protein